MAASVHERLYQLVTGNPGTGAVTVGAAVSGYQALAAGDNGNTFDVCIFDVDANGNANGKWEVQAQSAYTHAGTSLARVAGNVVDGSSGPGVLVNFAAGTQRVENSLTTAGIMLLGKGSTVTPSLGLRIQHNGTKGQIESITGSLRLSSVSAVEIGSVSLYSTSGANITSSMDTPGYRQISTGFIAFSPDAANLVSGCDVSIYRVAAGVIGGGGGGASAVVGSGWIQDTPGEAALTNNFTNNNGVLTATNFSFTVKSGRAYRITGMLQVANSTAGEGIKFAFDGGTATASLFTLVVSAIGTNVVGTQTAPSLVSVISFSSITGTNFLILSGYLLVLNGGTLIVRMAENTTATGTLTLSAGSWIKLTDTVLV